MAKKIKLVQRKKPLVIPPDVKVGGQGSWEDADAEMKKDSEAAKRAANLGVRAIPVESDKPGIARVPKAPKVPHPVPDTAASFEVVRRHFLRLMERLAAEQGGPHAKALEDLRRDIGE